MHLFCALLLAVMSSLAVAGDNPKYSCDDKPGCTQETSGPFDIGAGVLLDLPDGWTLLAYPQMQINDLKLRELRIFKGEVILAITPFPNLDGRTVREAWLRQMLLKSAGQYVRQSKEEVTSIESISHDDFVGAMYSFTSDPGAGRPFKVLPNRRFASVSGLTFSAKSIIFSVSVASEGEPDGDYRAALAAFRAVK